MPVFLAKITNSITKVVIIKCKRFIVNSSYTFYSCFLVITHASKKFQKS